MSIFQVQVYTVTKSGIVSALRFEEYMRIGAPSMNITTEDVAKTSAQFRLVLLESVLIESSECNINAVVFDMHSMAVYDKTLSLTSDMAPIFLQGLRPYHKYTINIQVFINEQVIGEKNFSIVYFNGIYLFIYFFVLFFEDFCVYAIFLNPL